MMHRACFQRFALPLAVALVAAFALTVAPAPADPEILPLRAVKGVKHAVYDLATGEFTPTEGPVRHGKSVWAATRHSGYYFPQIHYGAGATTLDWGDIAGPQKIGGFSFHYSSDVVLPGRFDVILLFFADENGWNSVGRTYLAAFTIPNAPGMDPEGTWSGWLITCDLDGPGLTFTISGSDLDGDGLADFGYTYWFRNVPPTSGNYTGPVVAGEPNLVPNTCPGIENAFDFFADPNLNHYWGTYWLGGEPFAQFYMELFDSELPDCPGPGSHDWHCTADITSPTGEPDCVVDLADLAQLLAHYPTASGATHADGDVEPEDGNGKWDPWDGDGDVDLADLAQLLSMYGDDCR